MTPRKYIGTFLSSLVLSFLVLPVSWSQSAPKVLDTVAVAAQTTCVIYEDGGVGCFGGNEVSQLGAGNSSRWGGTNQRVGGIAGKAIQISGGFGHFCVLTDSQDIYCWGNYSSRNPGGSSAAVQSPTAVKMNVNVGEITQLASGNYFDCALLATGAVKCWGDNSSGGLGNGTTMDSSTAVDVTGLTDDVAQISVKNSSACALQKNSQVMCWGEEHQSTPESPVFSTVATLSAQLPEAIQTLAVDTNHACALATSGSVYCWGSNEYGQVGNGGAGFANKPVKVEAFKEKVIHLSAGGGRSCAVTEPGEVYCWGARDWGLTISGSDPVPTLVPGITSPAVAVLPAYWHNCALLDSGKLMSWGNNPQNELGRSADTNAGPATTAGLVTVLDDLVKSPSEGTVSSASQNAATQTVAGPGDSQAADSAEPAGPSATKNPAATDNSAATGNSAAAQASHNDTPFLAVAGMAVVGLIAGIVTAAIGRIRLAKILITGGALFMVAAIAIPLLRM